MQVCLTACVCVYACVILTANLQFTLHNILSTVVDCLADVDPSVEGAGLAYLQRQHSLFAEHAVLGLIRDVHLVFVPGDFGLRGG